MDTENDHRICFIGDSFVQGTCDPECLGWVGRVASVGRAAGFNLTAYNLGIRRDTSRDVLQRWEAECDARFRFDCHKYVVFSFGANDTKMEQGRVRIDSSESISNFRSILANSGRRYRTLVVGPVPVGDMEQNGRIVQLDNAYASEAAALAIPYLSVAERLISSGSWLREVLANDGSHPGATGYAALASMVLEWQDWWFARPGTPH